MATTLALRLTTNNGISDYKDMVTTFGSAEHVSDVSSTNGGTEIQCTDGTSGPVLAWISGRVPSGGFTLSGTMNFSVWARESTMNDNCGMRARVFKYSGGSETEVAGGPFDDGVEMTAGTGPTTENTWTGSPTSTAFSENDRIVVKLYITNVGGSMVAGTTHVGFDAASASQSDSFFQINETVSFKAEDVDTLMAQACM